MIKINLLGVARPTAAAAVGAPPTVARQALIFAGALLVCLLVVGFIYKFWSNAVTKLEADKKREQAEAARLAAIQAENQTYLQRRKELEQRINTIQMLQNSRVGPVEVMNALGATVNRTNDLYLLTLTNEGGRMVIRGQSDSVQSIANFISALKQSGTFDDVQLRQYFQDDQANRASYKFNLDCVYKSPATAASTAAQAQQPAATPAPAARRGGM
jgi:Tfp pilus assembly protein PilN